MKLELLTPISVGQTALVQIYGNNDFGYVMVKVNGAYVTALPDESPGIPGLHRSVFGPPSGRGFNVWTNPQWKTHDSVLFELYDDATKTLQNAQGTVIL
ncbi:MAG TPA: hypothetical protein VFK05_20125 [Polyangiaceae bacterium]|nr:hypothetical protein [Polyangiaceae bacterium]